MKRFLAVLICMNGCEFPLNEEQLQGQVDERLDNLQCQIQSRLTNATNIAFREMCNDQDDDCDGEIDENLLDVLCENPCGIGLQHCVDGQWTPCSAPQPLEEVCDRADNDCDGVVDNLPLHYVATEECLSTTQHCVDGLWECVPVTPILSCTPVVTHAVADMRLLDAGSWSYALHSVDQPSEHSHRSFTLARLQHPLIRLSHWELYDQFEWDVLWSYTHEIDPTVSSIDIHADAYDDLETIGVSCTHYDDARNGFWHVDDGLIQFLSPAPYTDASDVSRFIPVAHGYGAVGVTQEMSEFMPPAGTVVVRDVTDHGDAVVEIGFARPDSVVARRYGSDTWIAWLPVEPIVRVKRLGASAHDITPDGVSLYDLHFVEATEPRVVYAYDRPMERHVVVHHVIGGVEQHYSLPPERRGIRAAQLGDGYAFISHVDGFVYVDVRDVTFEESFFVGRSLKPELCDVTVSSDLSGYGLYALCDTEGMVSYMYIRCE